MSGFWLALAYVAIPLFIVAVLIWILYPSWFAYPRRREDGQRLPDHWKPPKQGLDQEVPPL